jgi:ribosomal protein S12 methylthiotransferase accessory factor
LLEVIERDSMAMIMARDDSRLVRGASLPSPFQELVAKWEQMGMELIVRFFPNQFDLPCFEAAIHEPASNDLRLARGWGCHLDSRIALSRAVCEVAQTRIAAIKAPRRDRLRRRGDHASRAFVRMTEATDMIDFGEVPHVACNSVRSAMREVKVRLAGAGITRVFRLRMHFNGEPAALLGLHVVKVIVPLCESAVGFYVRMGPRLRERVAGKDLRYLKAR